MTPAFSDLLNCVSLKWTPGIGDPTLGGWITVVVYFTTAAACFVRGVELSKHQKIQTRRVQDYVIWICVGFLLIALGFNKQLDFQSGLTATGRCLSQMHGWYDNRKLVQALFVIAIGIIGTGFITAISFLIKRRKTDLKIALLGVTGVIVFVMIRAASFHHIDVFLRTNFAGLRYNWILEIGALLTILFGVYWSVFGPSLVRGRRIAK